MLWSRRKTGTFPLVVLILAFLVALPGAFLYFYQQKFGFHPLIILFGQAIVLFIVALVGLVTLGLAFFFASTNTRISARFLGATSAFLIVVLVLVYTGAYISNSLWGDTLNYGVALTFASHSRSVFDVLPVTPEQQKQLLFALLAASLTSLLVILLAAFAISSRVVSGVRHWLSEPTNSTKRFVSLASALAGATAITAGFCVACVIASPSLLNGEPISAFFKLVPTFRLLHADNARIAAAVEDRSSRATYQKVAGFERKNVILIFSDSLRADRMGVYGYHRPTTPFLSTLLANKQLHRVEMALSTCSESFCGIASTLASRPFHQISKYNFKLHDLLRDVGYRINFFLSGDHRSWNHLTDFYGSDIDGHFDHRTLNMKDVNDDGPVVDALERIDTANGQPNFFYLFLMSSHISGRRLPEFERYHPTHTDRMRLMTFWNELTDTRMVEGKIIASQGRVERQDLDAISNRYDNGVIQFDAYLARIFAILEAKGYLQESIVVILSDHGDGLGEHGHLGHSRYLYQEDIRIPLLIYDSSIERYRNGVFATQVDVAATIVERLGLTVPSGWQGLSLMKPPQNRITLHQTRRGRSPCFAVVERSSESLNKYIRCGDGERDSGEFLFDLVADPGEQTNLISTADIKKVERYRREIDSRFGVILNRCITKECNH